MKLEIGNERIHQRLGSDWKTLDIKEGDDVDIVHDLRDIPLPIKDNSCEVIYMSHVLEHLPWTFTGMILKELLRILQLGGTIDIWVPDLEKLAKAYLNNSLIKNDGWYRYNPDKDPTRWFNGRMFTYGPGEENFHKAAFDERYLRKCLGEAGFKKVERLRKPMGYDHGWINLGMRATK